MLQTAGKRWLSQQWPSALTLLLAMTGSSIALAADGNRYRAELLLVERIASEQDLDERMQSRHPSTPESVDKTLLAYTDSGQAYSDINLVSPNALYLNSAAQRLRNSGRYRILMAAGWYGSFPPNYKGERLKVAIGDRLPTGEPGDTRHEIEGFISIDRQRYLHVTAQLNHWEETPREQMTAVNDTTGAQSTPQSAEKPAAGTEPARAPAENRGDRDQETFESANPADQTPVAEGQPAEQTASQPEEKPPIQLRTWLHETRRMRSEEIHYLDSPTIGLLVYFEPIEDKPDEQSTSDDAEAGTVSQ